MSNIKVFFDSLRCKQHKKPLMLLWRHEKIRFLIVGGFNTVLSFGLFTGLYFLLSLHWHYLSILTLSFILSVSVAFLSMKLLVFQSSGSYRLEYLKCVLMYGFNFLVNAVLLHILVSSWEVNVILAQLFVTFWIAVQSYYGHKYFSFGSFLSRSNTKT